MLFAVLFLTAFLLIKKEELHKPEANLGLLFANLSPLRPPHRPVTVTIPKHLITCTLI